MPAIRTVGRVIRLTEDEIAASTADVHALGDRVARLETEAVVTAAPTTWSADVVAATVASAERAADAAAARAEAVTKDAGGALAAFATKAATDLDAMKAEIERATNAATKEAGAAVARVEKAVVGLQRAADEVLARVDASAKAVERDAKDAVEKASAKLEAVAKRLAQAAEADLGADTVAVEGALKRLWQWLTRWDGWA